MVWGLTELSYTKEEFGWKDPEMRGVIRREQESSGMEQKNSRIGSLGSLGSEEVGGLRVSKARRELIL